MQIREFEHEWVRLRQVFDKLPVFEEADEWFKVVKGFTAEVFADAVDDSIMHSRFTPKPVDLRNRCYAAKSKREQAAFVRAVETGQVCPYCGGSGWVTVVNFHGDGRDCGLPCGACDANRYFPHDQRVREFGRAMNDPGWKWDKARKELRRQTEWIGDEAPARMDEEFDFWGAVKGIGGAL